MSRRLPDVERTGMHATGAQASSCKTLEVAQQKPARDPDGGA